MTFRIMIPNAVTVMLKVVSYAEYCYAEYFYVECRCAECRYAQCRGAHLTYIKVKPILQTFFWNTLQVLSTSIN